MNTGKASQKPRQARRITAAVLAALWAAVIFALSCIPGGGQMPRYPEALNVLGHFCEYLLLAVLLTGAFWNTRRASRQVFWRAALLAVCVASLYGASDELHQLLANNGRTPDVLDWLTDTLGALAGVFAAVFLRSVLTQYFCDSSNSGT